MKVFYLHACYQVTGASRHFALNVSAHSKDEAIEIFQKEFGPEFYLTEVIELNNPLPTQVD